MGPKCVGAGTYGAPAEEEMRQGEKEKKKEKENHPTKATTRNERQQRAEQGIRRKQKEIDER